MLASSRQSLENAVACVVNWRFPFELALAELYGCP
jgi:hypothetical protein